MLRIKGFTLIELLIVVAIIAILAAIAVPNFLEAQVRSKVSRCKNDMRSLATGLEAYRTDYSKYPMDRYFYTFERSPAMSAATADIFLNLHVLTTPVAYMSSIPYNVFPNNEWGKAYVGKITENQYIYWSESWKAGQIAYRPNLFRDIGPIWSLSSVGPDLLQNQGSYLIFGMDVLERPEVIFFGQKGCIYDPTNGTMSKGDIVRIGP